MTDPALRALPGIIRVAAALLLATAVAAQADDKTWPQWGGPNRDFKSTVTGLSDQWPEDGPKQLWNRELGEGYTCVIADGERLYTMIRRDENEVVVALNPQNGETLWEHTYSAPNLTTEQTQFGPGPHSTPLVKDGRLFTVGVLGQFNCYDAATGEVKWSHDLVKEFDHKVMGRGYSSSPLAYDGNVILQVGGDGQAIVAFNAESGDIAWKNQSLDISHASPILIHFAGQDHLVCFMAVEIVGLNPTNGELIWRHEHPTQYGANISTPVYPGDGIIFMSSAYDLGSRVIQLEKDGDAIKPKELWYNRKLRIHHGNAIVVGDAVYGSSGDFGPAFLMCVDLKTGESNWRERGFAKANFVYADDKLIVLDEAGQLALIKASPESFEQLAKTQLLKRNAWSAPTLVGRILYVRDRKNLIALDLG